MSFHNLTDIQYTHPENLWTTIGVGELKEYTGALTGGYLELNGAPAELTISGQDFEFADFNFMQKDHSLEPGSVYAVKAVYEPGEDLMVESSNYRMISEPYYNKMNYPAAVGGGAYSVDVVFERGRRPHLTFVGKMNIWKMPPLHSRQQRRRLPTVQFLWIMSMKWKFNWCSLAVITRLTTT